jgi:hypothetical protein
VFGVGGATGAVVTGDASSVVTELSVDGDEPVSELQELRRNMHKSESAVIEMFFRMSVLATFS